MSVDIAVGVERKALDGVTQDTFDGEVVWFLVEQGSSAGRFEALGVIVVGEEEEPMCVLGGGGDALDP